MEKGGGRSPLGKWGGVQPLHVNQRRCGSPQVPGVVTGRRAAFSDRVQREMRREGTRFIHAHPYPLEVRAESFEEGNGHDRSSNHFGPLRTIRPNEPLNNSKRSLSLRYIFQLYLIRETLNKNND